MLIYKVGFGVGAGALADDLEALFGSLIHYTKTLMGESQGREGLPMLPSFLGVPITLLLS